MRRSRRVWIVFSMLFGLEGVLAGQAMVEYGLGAGRAASSAAPAAGVKKAVGGVAGSLDKVLKTGQGSSESGSPGAPRVVGPTQAGATEQAGVDTPAPVPAAPAKIYEDPSGIRAGMAKDELVRRFGPPTLEVVGASGGKVLTYSGKNGIIQLEMSNEKVALVAAMTPQQAAVVLK
jgi:hypothetical protein